MNNIGSGFYAAVESGLRRSEDRIVLTEGKRRWTGDMLIAEVERWAAALAALGVGAGDRIAVQAPKTAELVFLYLAGLRAGAVYLPLNNLYRPAEIGYFLGDAEPVLFVCDPSDADALAGQADAAGTRLMTLDAQGAGTLADAVTRAPAAPPPPAEPAPDDLAAIVYTSGTTGRAKGAMVTQRNLVSNARALVSAWGLGPLDRLLHALPLYHIHGLFVALNTMLLAGGRIDLLAAFDGPAVVRKLADVTVFMGVPTYYTRLLAEPGFDRDCARGVRLFVCGSAPLTPPVFDAFEARTGHRILERYGMSECGIICSNPLEGPRVPGAVGRPLSGVTVRIADGADIGVLEVSGPNVFKGYWRLPEKTRAEFRDDGFFVTGDVATIDGDGIVRIVGREKDLIISGGLNVYPKEIEDMIDGLPGVDESAVIGLPHPDFGEAVAAVVKPLPDATVDAAAIIDTLRPDLAAFKLPKVIFVVDELPRNAMGKVQKALLRERYQDRFA